jgi:hypothetical protein
MSRTSISRFSRCVEAKWKSQYFPLYFPYKNLFMSRYFTCRIFRCVEFFRGPYRINLEQFTLKKSFDYFNTFDLETFFTPYLAAKTISDQLVWQILITQPNVQTAFVYV